jgi:tellurite methyltransferase
MSGGTGIQPVSPFVAAWLPRLASAFAGTGRAPLALDFAMGDGRHAVSLAAAGFDTIGVDLSVERLRTARGLARVHGATVQTFAADLESYPLPADRFELLLCTRFLLRTRWQDLKDSVRQGGFVLYETFTVGQLRLGRGPSSIDHLLHPGELAAAFSEWDVMMSEEVSEPAAVARIVARKPVAQVRPL